MKYSFEIVKMELKRNQYGKDDILITMVKVLDENGKYIKFAKLNDNLIKAMKLKGTVKIKNNEA